MNGTRIPQPLEICVDLWLSPDGEPKGSMTKAEIIDAIYEKVGGFSKKEAAEVVEAVFDTMKDALADGENIKISGFGKFIVRDKEERVGRNPRTGEPMPIQARRVVRFKKSMVLHSVLNPHRAGDDAQSQSEDV